MTKTTKLLTIVGARPQFIKAAMVSKAIANHNTKNDFILTEEIIHTGQHYDPNMSHIFFEEMRIPQPAANLEVGSGPHGSTTADMLKGIEAQILERKPDAVLVYGDTNSTLAGALAASKLHIPLFHVEAGLRSFNKSMPEEINRILTDHVSDLLLCPTSDAIKNLANEGISNGVHHIGDVMYDAALYFGKLASEHSTILSELCLSSSNFYLSTVHRAENTDNQTRFEQIINALIEISSSECPVVLPLHPRTKAKLSAYNLSDLLTQSTVKIVPPIAFMDMVTLEKHAKAILTDSGGVQKEAYFHRTPCITLRTETEWIETVAAGWNQIVGYKFEKILNAVEELKTGEDISEYGMGDSSEKIVELIVEYLRK